MKMDTINEFEYEDSIQLLEEIESYGREIFKPIANKLRELIIQYESIYKVDINYINSLDSFSKKELLFKIICARHINLINKNELSSKKDLIYNTNDLISSGTNDQVKSIIDYIYS